MHWGSIIKFSLFCSCLAATSAVRATDGLDAILEKHTPISMAKLAKMNIDGVAALDEVRRIGRKWLDKGQGCASTGSIADLKEE